MIQQEGNESSISPILHDLFFEFKFPWMCESIHPNDRLGHVPVRSRDYCQSVSHFNLFR